MKYLTLLLSFLLFPLIGSASPQRAITFGEGGRLGDNILDYTHAKWISYKWGIPLLLYTFDYSDEFVLYDVEEHLTPEKASHYSEKLLSGFHELTEKIEQNTLYKVGHVSDAYEEYLSLGSFGLYIPVDWSDPIFREMMRDLISPKKRLKLVEPPNGVISVALHYRDGGGFGWDTETMKRGLPLRFPDISYYVKQLKRLTVLLAREPIFVHIFTDHVDPEVIKEHFRSAFPQPHIQFSCRLTGNRHDANVLEDMYSMTNFDCLIRPMSHYSMTAAHLKDFKIEFYPTKGHWENNRFIVDRVEVVERERWDRNRKQWVPKEGVVK